MRWTTPRRGGCAGRRPSPDRSAPADRAIRSPRTRCRGARWTSKPWSCMKYEDGLRRGRRTGARCRADRRRTGSRRCARSTRIGFVPSRSTTPVATGSAAGSPRAGSSSRPDVEQHLVGDQADHEALRVDLRRHLAPRARSSRILASRPSRPRRSWSCAASSAFARPMRLRVRRGAARRSLAGCVVAGRSGSAAMLHLGVAPGRSGSACRRSGSRCRRWSSGPANALAQRLGQLVELALVHDGHREQTMNSAISSVIMSA